MINLVVDKNKKRINDENSLGLTNFELIFWQNNSFQINDKSEVKSLIRKRVDILYDKLID